MIENTSGFCAQFQSSQKIPGRGQTNNSPFTILLNAKNELGGPRGWLTIQQDHAIAWATPGVVQIYFNEENICELDRFIAQLQQFRTTLGS